MKILIAGDFYPRGVVLELVEQERYEAVLGDVAPIIRKSDYSIVNFECAVVEGSEKPIEKYGPNLKCTGQAIKALLYAGFDCVTLANNHFRDFGDDGCISTIDELDHAGIDHVGGGKNLEEAQQTLYKIIGGVKVAIINICEHEFSIATNTTAGSSPLDPIDNYYQIRVARTHADYVIVIVHGGHEHYQLPSPRMKKTYRWFVEMGADAVINHHQHCYSGYEVYKNKPIFYGIGNFCMPSRKGFSLQSFNEGFMVELDITEMSINLIPYFQCYNNSSIVLMKDEQEKQFYSYLENLNSIILDDDALINEFEKWCNRRKPFYDFLLSPYPSNKFLRYMYRKGFLPKMRLPRKRLELKNYIECESHYDVFKKILY